MIKTSKTLTTLGLCISLVCAAASATAADKSAAEASIALSNSFAGNTWRQQMISVWNQAAKEAIDQNLIGKTKVVNADNSAPQQASQLENLILEGWKAIAIDAASPTALNGAIQEACDQGIVVVAFDAKVTAPCAYNVVYDYQNVGRLPAQFLADKLNGKGNVLVVRGLAGTSIDADEYEGAKSVFAKYPDLKIVGMVNGNWTESVAQKEVSGILPALGKVDAVLAQGGDSYGIYQAFKAAGRDIPLITLGGRSEELALWKKLNSETRGGYDTVSSSTVPGVSSVAFWVAQQVLAGNKVPKVIHMPLLKIKVGDLDQWIAATPEGSVATSVYSREWTHQLIQANLNNTPLPDSPLPAEKK
ncbi:ABC transporter substrate-binding protein [Sodalis ligni]|jgi:ribose transport system substrate-binding protein|uniref:Monosaccharide ABC transporter substrate-binding protein (CUT2 family) n=1 Tax=Sodalis ligni TaxID=2697027 RepID=A0A4R1N916_9GAMM|nr:ABC transporter substrate-binding protein [Sodalis ligni]TCL03157.1 monosaccharide ABC transporter substrate-binding protein (CUT2 family) [Sodalis ligni]